jgi:pimeloyl-ACP methyl ester carboxylesterase
LSGRPERLLFLPGASGDTCFWRPLEQRLTGRAERLHLGWPGFGDTLARPLWVTHLVLCATSGGLPMASLGAADWRENVRTSLSHLPDWFATETTDLSDRLPEVATPTLLLWGDSDPFSPIAVGERLARQLPQARLEVIPNSDHDLGLHHAERLAPLPSPRRSRAIAGAGWRGWRARCRSWCSVRTRPPGRSPGSPAS